VCQPLNDYLDCQRIPSNLFDLQTPLACPLKLLMLRYSQMCSRSLSTRWHGWWVLSTACLIATEGRPPDSMQCCVVGRFSEIMGIPLK